MHNTEYLIKSFIDILELDIINATKLINDKQVEIDYKNKKLGELKSGYIIDKVNNMTIKDFRDFMKQD